MLAYIRDFTPYQIGKFWFPFTYTATVCRMYISLKNKGVAIFEVYHDCENTPGQQHAEIVAYNAISKMLFARLNEHKEPLNNEYQLDFAIAMNNSSCKDCRREIALWIHDLKKLINGARLQLTLFFSNLYVVEENSDVVVLFTDWIISLVQTYGIYVDICPIIISKMLPKQDYGYRLKDLLIVTRHDIACLENFKKLFRRLFEVNGGTYVVQCNEISDLFKADKPVNQIYLKIFTWESPQGISIRPTDKHYFPTTLQESSTTLQESSTTLQESSTTLQESSTTLQESSQVESNDLQIKSKTVKSKKMRRSYPYNNRFIYSRSKLPWYKKRKQSKKVSQY